MYDDQTAIAQVYEWLNAIPAQLSAKGKIRPEATVMIEANTRLSIMLKWAKPNQKNTWEGSTEFFFGDSFGEVVAKADAFILALPNAEQAKLQDFMNDLGHLIDSGREVGIDVNYLNPLVESMKLLSENAITYKPLAKEI